MEQYRKQAKALVRAFRTGDEEARRRAAAVLEGHERDRFLLSDAQHVIAREQGLRTWAELKRAEEARAEWNVASGLRYTDAEPVLVHVKKRLHRHLLDDRRAAARIAGLPPGLRAVAHETVVGGYDLNVDRRGGVFVPTVYPHLLPELTDRVARASLALYLALLDLEETGSIR